MHIPGTYTQLVVTTSQVGRKIAAPAKHRHKVARRRSLLIGLGSVLDVTGLTTYERLRREMPPVRRRTQQETYQQVAKLFETPTKR